MLLSIQRVKSFPSVISSLERSKPLGKKSTWNMHFKASSVLAVLKKYFTGRKQQQSAKEKAVPRAGTADGDSYGGYHFTPYGLFSEKENSDFKYLTRKLRTDTELGFFVADNIAGRTRKYRYNYKAFYAAAGNSRFDIFKCSGNGKLYVPGAFELFGYTESI